MLAHHCVSEEDLCICRVKIAGQLCQGLHSASQGGRLCHGLTCAPHSHIKLGLVEYLAD